MPNLRKLAKDRPCEIRVPSYCQGDPARTVGCHIRLIGVSGIGLKAPDLFIAHGCQLCHDICDGRVPSNFSYEQRRLMLLEGMVRTQFWLIKQGKIKW